MSRAYTAPSDAFFDADEYSREMPEFPEGSQSSYYYTDSSSSQKEQPNRYVPPHHRNVNLDMGDDVQVEQVRHTGPDEQGVDNKRFQKLIIYINYALTKAMIMALSSRFPACFFVSKDHRNHDHPIAHGVTHVATRFLQRMIPGGARCLDIYGNPRAAEAFNANQKRGNNPKTIDSLCSKSCPADFIREINKWGPWLDFKQEGSALRYFLGRIAEQTSQFLESYDVFTMIHTLYYVSTDEIAHLLGAKRGSKILALIHDHPGTHGFLNDHEQEYWVQGGVVKQKNVKTNTCYYHKNITPFWFAENKTFTKYCSLGNSKTHRIERAVEYSFTWELHFVCENTWIVEIVANYPSEVEYDGPDWEAQFNAAAAQTEAIKEERFVRANAFVKPVTVLPSKEEGKFIELNVEHLDLFSVLRRKAMGRDRRGKEGVKLWKDLWSTAKFEIQPSALFPDKVPIGCPDHLIIDHVTSAFVTDMVRETNVMEAMGVMRPVLEGHVQAMRKGMDVSHFSTFSLFSSVRSATRGAIAVNRIVKSKDAVGTALGALDDALDDYE